jgi:hypothetical protein
VDQDARDAIDRGKRVAQLHLSKIALSGIVRNRQESSGIVKELLGIVRNRQESSGIARNRQEEKNSCQEK